MPELVFCPSCERKLRLPDELLGKEVKCPTCGTQFLAKAGESAPSSKGDASPPSPVRSKEPPPRDDPPEGVSPRRSQRGAEPDDEPRPSARRSRDDDEDEADVPASRRRSRRDEDDDDDDRPSRRRRRGRRDDYDDDEYGRRRYLTPHRGGTILTLGILSFCLCPIILGPIAFFMGNSDIAQMDAGTMDPEGRGLTNAGRICGLIGFILGILGCVLRIGIMAANNGNNNQF